MGFSAYHRGASTDRRPSRHRYGDHDHMGFGHLRVLNEDRVESGTGFGTHPHREFEIFSYLVDGELEQYVFRLSRLAYRCPYVEQRGCVYSQDSMGNTEVMRRGDLQMTSAGTGIRHSEKCHGPKQVHFLQIWAKPSESNLSPKYYTRFVYPLSSPIPYNPRNLISGHTLTTPRFRSFFRHFSDEDKRDKWAHIVAPVVKDSQEVVDKREASGPAPVHAPLDVFATILSPTTSLAHTAKRANVYAHLIQRSGYNTGSATGAAVKIDVGGDSVQLREGDGVYITLTPGAKVEVENVGEKDGEFLLFDTE